MLRIWGRTLNRFAFVNGNPVSFVDPFGLEGSQITEEQEKLAQSGDFLAFWKSRWVCGDPVAKTALIGWGESDLVKASWFEKWSAKYTWWALSSYISDNHLPVSMKQIGRALAIAHMEAIKLDQINVPNLLSPTQVAEYHHDVFKNYGIPAHLFGGTLPVGLYIPDISGGIVLYSVHVPVPSGWSGPARFEADLYSSMWCDGCDNQP